MLSESSGQYSWRLAVPTAAKKSGRLVSAPHPVHPKTVPSVQSLTEHPPNPRHKLQAGSVSKRCFWRQAEDQLLIEEDSAEGVAVREGRVSSVHRHPLACVAAAAQSAKMSVNVTPVA